MIKRSTDFCKPNRLPTTPNLVELDQSNLDIFTMPEGMKGSTQDNKPAKELNLTQRHRRQPHLVDYT